MTVPTFVVSQQERNARREALLVKEKELTRARDALAAERRRLPMVRASAGSQEAIRNYRARMGWADWPWYTTTDGFSADFDVSAWWGINVFLRDGDQIYRSYYTAGRAAEELSSIWALLDITPFSRQEEWQDAPEGVPQDRTGSWTPRHDEYTQEQMAGGRTSS
jgi:predicted dithiol-disulfide oxidoreductase (DUF899 family)